MSFNIQVSQSSRIDYKNIYDTFGVLFRAGSYESLLAPSSIKNYVTNKSRLQHGTIYAAEGRFTKMKERSVSLQMVIYGNSYDDYLQKLEAFIEFVSSGITLWRIPKLKRTFKLVYSSCGNFKYYPPNNATFTLEMKEPNPTDREQL